MLHEPARARRGSWDVSQPAVDALNRRLTVLERHRQALAAGAKGCEKAAVWLEREDREQAMRRLREITAGVVLPLDSLGSLRDTLDDDA